MRRFDAGQDEMTRDSFVTDTPSQWPPALAQLVAAARAPAQPSELAGEDAVAAAFREARTAAAPRRTPRTVARVLAVKIAAGAAVLAAGGYAVAAATGAVPSPRFGPDRLPVPAATMPATDTSPTGGPTTPTGTATEPPAATATEPHAGTPGPGGRPAESYAGLCRAYLEAPPAAAARLLDTPAMRDVVAAAGGKQRVHEFCTSAAAPSHRPSTGGNGANPKPTKSPKATRSTTDKPDKTTGPSPDLEPHSPPGGGPV
jgi:hypothetical protein